MIVYRASLLFIFSSVACVLGLSIAHAETVENELKRTIEQKGFVVEQLQLISSEPVAKEAHIKDINCFFNIERCKVNLSNKQSGTSFIWYRVQTKSKAMYLTRSKEQGDVLNSRDIAELNGNNFRCSSENNTVKSELAGSRLKVALKQGSVLCLTDIASEYAVHKGDDIKLVSLSESFKIEMRVVAMSSANLGEQIKVRVKSTGKIIPATVVALNTVRSLK